MKISINIHSLLRNLRNGWKRFMLTPERYWNIVVVGFFLFCVCVLAGDAWIFWQYALKLESNDIDPKVAIQSLDRARFDTVLNNLSDKESIYRSTGPVGTTTYNIFD